MLVRCQQSLKARIPINAGGHTYRNILRFTTNAGRFKGDLAYRTSTLLKPQNAPSLPALANSSELLHTSGIKSSTCMPTQLPPKCGPTNCVIPKPNVWKDCRIRKRPKWKGCDKICMPCCCPAISPPDCETIEIRQNTCKRLEYRIPSFSECRKYPLGKKIQKECCVSSMPCPEAGLENLVEPLIATKIRQETILGRRTGGKAQARGFSTSAVVMKQQSGDCRKQKSLACLKPSGVLINGDTKKSSNKSCEKQCLPCCRPARDPPDCNYPATKVDCNRPKPPRPSYSECKKEKLKKISECDCRVIAVKCSKEMESSASSC